MRNLLLACLFVAMPLVAADADDVKAAEMNWFNGITKNNFPLLEKVLADDLHYLHSTGVVDTKVSYIKSMSSGKQKYSSGKINDLKSGFTERPRLLTATPISSSSPMGNRGRVT